jgi:hypothetical protein
LHRGRRDSRTAETACATALGRGSLPVQCRVL